MRRGILLACDIKTLVAVTGATWWMNVPASPMTIGGLSVGPVDSANVWVGEAMVTMGGKSSLTAVRALHMVGVAEMAGVAFSPHVTQPRMTYTWFDEWRDVEGRRFSRHAADAAPNFPAELKYRVIVDVPGRAAVQETERFGTFPLDAVAVEAYANQLDLAPERLLATAAAAGDLVALHDTTIEGLRYHTVAFARGRTRVVINAITHLPLAVESTRSFDTDPDWAIWGDVVTRTTFSSWSRERGGVRLPRTWTTTRNGQLFERVSIMTLDLADSVAPDSFAIPDSLRRLGRAQSPVSLGNGQPSPLREIADGVVFVPGIWSVLLVRQADGVVVIEAPHSPAYSRLVITEVARRFPRMPIKGVVITDFMWSHHAGVREYAARGVPIYAPATNVTEVQREMAAPHRLAPDSLERAPRKPHLVAVGSRLTIGTGPNRLELVSALGPGTDYGEHMLVAYLPGHRLLWASDLLPTPMFEPNFVRQGTADVVALVAREGLTVDSVAAIHIAPTAWRSVVASVEQ